MEKQQVVFRNVAQVYFPQSRVDCHYSLTAESAWSSRDWIGLFQVGWASVNDYHTYVWANAPEGPMMDYTEGTQVNGQALFTAYYLPSPGETQYQFVYVAEGGEVKGQSGSFTFSAPKPLAEPLVDTLKEGQDGDEVELVVSRTTLLQSQLSESEQLVKDLHHALDLERQEADREKESSRKSRSVWEEERGAMKEVISELREKLRLSMEQLHSLEARHQDVQYTRGNMSSELSTLWMEKTANQQRISELEEHVKTLSDSLAERDSQIDSMKEREKNVSTELKRQEEKNHELEAAVRELRERLSSQEHMVEALRKELYEAGLQRDHAHTELHKLRLHKAQMTLMVSGQNLKLYEDQAAWTLERETLKQAAETEQKRLQQREAELEEEKEERQKAEEELSRERADDYRELNYARQEIEELKRTLERVQLESQEQRDYIYQLERKPEEEKKEEKEEESQTVEEVEQKQTEVSPIIVLTLSSHREVETPLVECMSESIDEWRCNESYSKPEREPALSDNDLYLW